MHSALAVAAPAAVSELRAQGVLGVGRLRSLAVAVVAIGVSLGCLVAVRSAVGGLNALQLAMFSVGGWALLIANGLSGAYLGGTGTRDVHGIVDHLPLRRVDLAMLPFALGGLRSGILSALLCGIALVALGRRTHRHLCGSAWSSRPPCRSCPRRSCGPARAGSAPTRRRGSCSP